MIDKGHDFFVHFLVVSIAFDLEKRMCYRRQLKYYSKYGDVIVRDGDLAPA